MDEGRKERLARNEAAFRKVNESIGSRDDAPSTPVTAAYLCECGALGCNELVELSREDYEAVRAHSRRFFLIPGHEEPEVETVVERREGFFVVEKHPEEAGVAESTDPRS